MPEKQNAAVLETSTDEPEVQIETEDQTETRHVPRYNILLWNDDHHTFEYVIIMLRQLFGYPSARGLQLAKEVDTQGRTVVLTTTKEYAEFKRDQIHAFGQDPGAKECEGAMSATIEPAE